MGHYCLVCKMMHDSPELHRHTDQVELAHFERGEASDCYCCRRALEVINKLKQQLKDISIGYNDAIGWVEYMRPADVKLHEKAEAVCKLYWEEP